MDGQIPIQPLTSEQKEKNMIIIFWAITVSPVIYLLVCELLLRFTNTPQNTIFVKFNPEMYKIFKIIAIALTSAAGIWVLSVKRALNLPQPMGPGGAFLNSVKAQNQSKSSAALSVIINILAICEVPAVLGLALFILNEGSRIDAYPFIASSVIFMLLFIPSRETLDKLYNLGK